MKKIYLLLSGCLIVGESMELKNDYTAETREYNLTTNKHGVVLNRKNEKIYLGKSCDVSFEKEGKGHWGYYENGSIWLKFENKISYRIRGELPKKYTFPTKDIKISYDDIYAKCIGNLGGYKYIN